MPLPRNPKDRNADAETNREAVLTSAKAQIASSDATIKAGRKALDVEAAKTAVEADLATNDAELVQEERKCRAADTARYEAPAREHEGDFREEGLNEALSRIAPRRKS